MFPLFFGVPSCYWTIWLSLFMVIKMFDWFWWILYCTLDIHTRAYSPLHDEIMFGQWYIDGWSLLVVYLTTSTSDIILGHILLSFARFVWEMVWGWMISVGCLSHDFDIGSYTGAYFPIFFTYPWDWNSDQLSFRLCTSLKLLTIDCIRTFLHGFVEIEMAHIRFHPRRIGGSFR